MMDESLETAEELRDVLRRNGFVRCDIPACNCGSWHARYGLRERLDEVKDALADAGHPLTNENGNLVSGALAALLADSARLEWLMRNISGIEFRRIGIEYGGNCGRDRIDAAMNKVPIAEF